LFCAVGPPSTAGSSHIAVPSLREPSAAAGGGSGGGGGSPVSAASGTVEQIAMTLLRLQQDMNNVLVRLQSLETLTQQQANVFLDVCYVLYLSKSSYNIQLPLVLLHCFLGYRKAIQLVKSPQTVLCWATRPKL